MIGLYQPKSGVNIGAALRAAYAFGAAGVYVSGRRYERAGTDTFCSHRHLPLVHVEDLLSVIPHDCVPVGVEIVERAKPLETYPHPPSAYYLFGPEDGSLPNAIVERCRDVVRIPSRACLNLAATVNVVLYDRAVKRGTGFEPRPMNARYRGVRAEGGAA